MARPKKYNIDTKEVVKLASYGCTNKEIADFFGCSADLLEKSYSEFLRKGKVDVKIRLRQLQWASAENGNVTMQIFLGKNMLGQQDKIEQNELEEPLVWSSD
jgi:hypothetical protein